MQPLTGLVATLGDVATSADFLAMVRVVKLLALPYSDHPDYREGWRPEP